MAGYKEAGVDIDAGNKSEDIISQAVKRTYNREVVSGVGSFGAVYSLAKVKKMKNPLLVSTVDGVGTKLKIAAALNRWDTIGVDIVNHCSNDILAMGATPLYFLDYLASAKMSPEVVGRIVKGMADACIAVGCPLIGGETAEMPGVYYSNEYDVVGCMVGVVDRKYFLDGSKIRKGDAIIALASNGLHTNGYSLARYVLFEKACFKETDIVPEFGHSWGDELLAVHKSYSANVLALMKSVNVKGIAHITGGGIPENVPRIMPKGLSAGIDYSASEVPEVFKLIQRMGHISDQEMFRTFNMGVGLVLVVSKQDVKRSVDFLSKRGETAWVIGRVVKG